MSQRTLTTTSEEAKLYLRIEGASIKAADFLPDMVRVERDEIIPIIGQVEYDSLLTAYETSITGGAALSSQDAALLDAIRNATVPLCFCLAAPEWFTSIADSGLMIKDNIAKGSRATTKWGYQELKLNLLTKGMTAIDGLYTFLDNQASGTFPAWEAYGDYTRFHNRFIQSTIQFDNEYRISQNRRTFIKLEPVMNDVEEMEIKPLLGEDFFNDLKTKLATKDTLSSYEKTLIAKLRKMIAYFSMYYGYDRIIWVQQGNSVTAQPNTRSDEYGSERGGDTLPDTAIERLKQDCKNWANKYTTEMLQWLEKNASQFSVYTASQFYIDKTTQPRAKLNHEDSKTFFF